MESDIEAEEITEEIQIIEADKYDDEGDFQQSMTVGSFTVNRGSFEDEGTSSQVTEDSYTFDVSIAITETETEEISAEFSDALKEIDGKRTFSCSQCDKVCKSKGGLTRHTKSKHIEGELDCEPRAVLCEDTVTSFVESIKVKLREDNFYGTEVNVGLATVSTTAALLDALLPLYKTFCHKKNQDKLLESFYGLIPRSCELLNCQDFKVANLIMIHLPEHLIGFYNTSHETTGTGEGSSTPKAKPQLDSVERGPLSYVAGYVISKLYQLNRKKKGEGNQELQALLQIMKCSEPNNYISARTRGGLITPCKDLVNILEVAEISFREHVDESKLALRNIPAEMICNSTLDSPIVKSLWDNIVVSCEIQPSKSTQKLCLENVIKLYLRVRSFSYTRDYITKYRIKEKQSKKKALRKEMKMSDTNNA